MKEKELSELSDQELLAKRKTAKTNQLISAGLVGMFVGIAVYSAVKNGFGFFTFFPLFFVYLLVRNQQNTKAIDQEMEARNLK